MTKTATKPADQISPWMPETDQHRLAILGKLAEEAGELASRAARCIIHGLDEKDPETGRSNRDELAREAADVEACLEIARETLAVVSADSRKASKANGFRLWHSLIEKGRVAAGWLRPDAPTNLYDRIAARVANDVAELEDPPDAEDATGTMIVTAGQLEVIVFNAVANALQPQGANR